MSATAPSRAAVDYANGDIDFARWIDLVDRLVNSVAYVSLFDLADIDLRGSFDDGVTPSELLDDLWASDVLEAF